MIGFQNQRCRFVFYEKNTVLGEIADVFKNTKPDLGGHVTKKARIERQMTNCGRFTGGILHISSYYVFYYKKRT